MSQPGPPDAPPEHDRLDARPPLLGSWRNLYAAVLLALATYIAVGAWITWSFAP